MSYCLRFEQIADAQRRIPAERSDELAGLLRVQQRFVGLGTQPADDRDATIAIDHEGVVRVAHDACELRFENPVEDDDDGFLIASAGRHGPPPFSSSLAWGTRQQARSCIVSARTMPAHEVVVKGLP
jgi:hypothetical protein